MSAILETRRAVPQLVIDVADGFLASRAAPGRGRVRPRVPVRARVLTRVTGPVETFDPPWRLITTTTPGGVLAWFGHVRPDSVGDSASGEGDRVGVLGPGTYDLELVAAGYQPTVLQAAIPAAGAPPSVLTVDLEAAADYVFPGEVADVNLPSAGRSTGPTLLRGQVLALDGSGLADVPVAAPLAVPARTDRNGSWVLVFPDDTPSGTVTVTAAIGGAAVTATTATVARRRTTVSQARLSGRTVRQSGAPVTGASISVAGVAGTVSSGTDGSWSLALPFGMGAVPITVTVTAVHGPTTRTQAGVAVVPGGTVTVPDHVFPNP
jgi:hypothetical protein